MRWQRSPYKKRFPPRQEISSESFKPFNEVIVKQYRTRKGSWSTGGGLGVPVTVNMWSTRAKDAIDLVNIIIGVTSGENSSKNEHWNHNFLILVLP